METKRFDRTDGQTVEFYPGQRLAAVLSALDAFLSAVQGDLPTAVAAFETSLLQRLKRMEMTSDALTGVEGIPLESDPLRRAYALFALECAGYPAGRAGAAIQLPRENALKSMLLPAYYRYRALCDVLGQGDAVPWIKSYIDQRTRQMVEPDLSLEDVDGYWRELSEVELPTSGVAARFNRGKNAFRIESCMWHDITQPLNDPEIGFLVCCYADTAAMEALNPHFSYTCQTTLVQGDAYCSKCTVDRRHVSNTEPPDLAFFDALGDIR